MHEGFDLERFMFADGSSQGLSNIIVARTGSGKTEWLKRMIHDSKNIENESLINKVVYISPKEENILDAKTVFDKEDLSKILEKDDLVVYVPSPEDYNGDVDGVIDRVFEMQNEIPYVEDGEENKFLSYHIVIDDASIFLSAQKPPSSAIKKLIISGRGRRVKTTIIVHRFNQIPRLVSGNLGGLIVLSVAKTDLDLTERLFAFRLDDIAPDLDNFKWAYIDLLQNDPQPYKYNPIIPVGDE